MTRSISFMKRRLCSSAEAAASLSPHAAAASGPPWRVGWKGKKSTAATPPASADVVCSFRGDLQIASCLQTVHNILNIRLQIWSAVCRLTAGKSKKERKHGDGKEIILVCGQTAHFRRRIIIILICRRYNIHIVCASRKTHKICRQVCSQIGAHTYIFWVWEPYLNTHKQSVRRSKDTCQGGPRPEESAQTTQASHLTYI